MLNELAKKNEDLEDKITSLLDLLYGCNDCGRHGDYCECDDMEGNDVQLPAPVDQNAFSQPSPPPTVAPCVPRPSSNSPPWTNKAT